MSRPKPRLVPLDYSITLASPTLVTPVRDWRGRMPEGLAPLTEAWFQSITTPRQPPAGVPVSLASYALAPPRVTRPSVLPWAWLRVGLWALAIIAAFGSFARWFF